MDGVLLVSLDHSRRRTLKQGFLTDTFGNHLTHVAFSPELRETTPFTSCNVQVYNASGSLSLLNARSQINPSSRPWGNPPEHRARMLDGPPGVAVVSGPRECKARRDRVALAREIRAAWLL